MSTLPGTSSSPLPLSWPTSSVDIYGVAVAGIACCPPWASRTPLTPTAGGRQRRRHRGNVRPAHEIRNRTDALDSLGNTTAATGKGFAIGSAALTALALLPFYAQAVGITEFRCLTPASSPGFSCALLPAVFCSLALNAVANRLLHRQRSAPPVQGNQGPEWKAPASPTMPTALDICTRASTQADDWPPHHHRPSPRSGRLAAGPRGPGRLPGWLHCYRHSSWQSPSPTPAAPGITPRSGGNRRFRRQWAPTAHKAAVIAIPWRPMKDNAGPSLNIMIKLASISRWCWRPLSPTSRHNLG